MSTHDLSNSTKNDHNKSNNVPNGSNHGPLQDGELYTAKRVFSDVTSSSLLLPNQGPQVSNHLTGLTFDARCGSVTTIGRDRQSTQHIYIYNVFNFFPGPYLVNETPQGRQRVTSIATSYRPIVIFGGIVLIGAVLVARHYFTI